MVTMNDTVTPAPHELDDFIARQKAKGVRSYKGDFVCSDGTRIPIDVTFDRAPREKAEE